MKKRVLQLIGSFHQGGSERQAVNLVKLLKQEGSFEAFAATLNNEGVLRAEIDSLDLAEIREFRLSSFYGPNFLLQVRRCVKYLRGSKIDVVHTHDFYTNIFGMTAARFAGVPVRIASKRETGGMRSNTQRLVEKFAFRLANSVVVNSAAVRDHLLTQRINSEKIHIICNGIDVDRFNIADKDPTAIRKKLGVPADEKIRFITMVANLRHDVKNVPMLIRAAKRIVEIRNDLHFIVAGEGELAAEMKEMARHVGVAENIHFVGRCDDVPALLKVSYACVLTSTAEGFSNSILEYMAAGKPVVATNVGGASEAVIDSETGFLVASDDDKAMSDRLIELLDDKRKASALGENGRNVVREKFSQENQLRATIELYSSFQR